MKLLFVTSLLIILIGVKCRAAKILAFLPLPGKSHHNIVQPILIALAKRGHQIDYYSPFPIYENNENVTVIQIKNFMKEVMETLGPGALKDYAQQATHTKIKMGHIMYGSILDETCKIPEVIDLIKSDRKYDLVIHESFFNQDYANALTHKFKALAVGVLPTGEWATGNEFAGLPDNPSYMIDSKVSYSDRMTFFERLHNTYVTTASVLSYYYSLYAYQRKVDDCFKYPGWESRPSLAKLASDNALILSNSHHSFGYPYPKAPHVKEIGGVNILPNKPLPKDLDTFINNAKDGVIYFSLGSVADMSTMIDPRFKDIFAKTFARLKENVLWKWNGEPFDVSKNVKLQKWFPQQDILAHKNVKLFISHGGVLSSFEAVHYGVPVLAIPIFGDQEKNARRIALFGLGEHLDWSEITEETLYQTIRKILDDHPRYKKEAVRRSALMTDRLMAPIDEAVYWIEYVLKHGRVLQPYSVHLSFIQLQMIDVYGFIIAVFLVLYFVTRFIARSVINAFKRKPSRVNPSSNKKRQ